MGGAKGKKKKELTRRFAETRRARRRGEMSANVEVAREEKVNETGLKAGTCGGVGRDKRRRAVKRGPPRKASPTGARGRRERENYRSRASFRARWSARSLAGEREPTKWVRSDLRRLTRLSHIIQLWCLRPSPGPTETWVESPSRLEKTGAQTTVEKRESISTCRLTITKVRYGLGSPPGRCTR